MDHSDLDRAYSCAKAADAATLSGDFMRAARAHSEAADFFASAAAAAPKNPGAAMIQTLAATHRSRGAYLASGRARQLPASAIAAATGSVAGSTAGSGLSPADSPASSMRGSRTVDSIDDLVSRTAMSICRSLDAAIDRDPSESFYVVDSIGDVEAAKRGARAVVKQELNALAKELKDRERDRDRDRDRAHEYERRVRHIERSTGDARTP